MRRMKGFIYAQEDWPYFSWNDKKLLTLLGEVRNLQGRLTGKMANLGFDLKNVSVLFQL